MYIILMMILLVMLDPYMQLVLNPLGANSHS